MVKKIVYDYHLARAIQFMSIACDKGMTAKKIANTIDMPYNTVRNYLNMTAAEINNLKVGE